MNADEPLYTLAKIEALCAELNPDGFCSRINELLRGGLPSASWGEGSRSAEIPLPGFDNFDMFLRQQNRYFRQALDLALKAMRDALAAQNAVVGTLDPDEAAIEAAGDLGDRRWQCVHCKQVKKRTPSERPQAGRCNTCYQYWKTHDHKDRPFALIERDIERKMG